MMFKRSVCFRVLSICFSVMLGRSVLGSNVHGYFEDRLVCVVNEADVTVSLDTTHTGSGEITLCFQYLQQIATKLDVVELDLQRAQQYLEEDTDDRVYWQEVVDTLAASRDQFVLSQELILTAMYDFETELFVTTKSLVGGYLIPQYTQLRQKLDDATLIMDRIVRAGNMQQFLFVQERVTQRNRVLIVLEAIKQSTSFDMLVPALREYFALTQEETLAE